MAMTVKPCTVCGTRNKRPYAARCKRHAKRVNPASLRNLNTGEKDLSAAEIEAVLRRVERPRWRVV